MNYLTVNLTKYSEIGKFLVGNWQVGTEINDEFHSITSKYIDLHGFIQSALINKWNITREFILRIDFKEESNFSEGIYIIEFK